MKFMTALFLSLTFAHTAYAVGVFGPNTKLRNLNGVDQKGCEAAQLLEQEYLNNGINVVDGTAPYIWDCSGVTSAEADDKRCPFPQYLESTTGMKCYSNSATGAPFVCVRNPRAETITASYGDVGTQKEYQPRFSELVVVRQDGSGFRRDSYFRMDSAGCKVENVRNESGTVTFADCSRKFDAALGGGNMYDSDISTVKFCDPADRSERRMDGFAAKTSELNNCFESIPDFMNRYKASKRTSSTSATGAGTTTSTSAPAAQ